MDSVEDASRQLGSSYLLRQEDDFCDRPFCLGNSWHTWGSCSTVSSTATNASTVETITPVMNLDCDNLFGWSSECEDPAFLSELNEELMRMSELVEPPVQPLHMRYAIPKTDEEVTKARAESVPKKTRDDTAYCVRLWTDWAENRNTQTNVLIPSLMQLDCQGLQYWLTRFILEIRTKKGTEYTPNTLHHIVCGIMRHIRQNCGKPEIDFFKDPDFADFRSSLDAEMKRLQAAGIGSVRKQAEPITMDEEELLWEKNILGDHSPEALLNTMVFMNGLYFALRSGIEHRQLRHHPCQIQVIENPGERPYLQYTEDISKNHPGGLKGRKHKPKIVIHHANLENPSRCFVQLFKLYNKLCPVDRPHNAFYLATLSKPKEDCWFSRTPLGHNTLKNFMKNTCKKADIPGYKTNHSLQATTATRLYAKGIDEQLVMERTGHRSIEGVRSYKWTSNEQQENTQIF